VKCTGDDDGVEKAVEELEKTLRGMGIRPRGEKDASDEDEDGDKKGKDTSSDTDAAAAIAQGPTDAIFVHALHDVLREESRDRDKDKTGPPKSDRTDVDVLRRMHMQRGAQNCADALKMASQLL
jgi:hypothetical protein